MKMTIRYLAVLAYAFSAVALASTSISKVNGSVRVDEREQAGDVSTVNGSVTIGADATAEDVETVNGSLRIDDRARTQDLETVNGDIHLATNSRVMGGIHYDKSHTWYKSGPSQNPRLTIEPGAVVEGPLFFEREIDLYVAPGVSLPAITGVEPKRFTLQ